MKSVVRCSLLFLAGLVLASLSTMTSAASFQKGDILLKSVGPLAVKAGIGAGDDSVTSGILFVSDTKAAAIYAVQTQEGDDPKSDGQFKVEKLGEKVAAVLGTSPDQVRIIDLAVNSASRVAYLSVMRGQGTNAAAVILSVNSDGRLNVMSLKEVQYMKVALPNPPKDAVTGQGRRQRNQRMESITDIAYVNGKVVVAGLSNEEFSSTLRTIPFPFGKTENGSGVKIFHGAHGRYETHSPVRTFVNYDIAGEPHILAAYTCTPLVKIPMVQLKPGARVEGTTIAELGNRNRPLDMITYKKNGKDYFLLANSSRGVMKITTENLEKFEGINERVGGGGTKGVPYETLQDWTKVLQLAALDHAQAMVVRGSDGGSLTLEAVQLP